MSTILIIFSFLVIAMVIDRNVEDYVVKLVELAFNKIRRFIWVIFNHPLIYTKSIFKFFIFLKYYFHSIRTRPKLITKNEEKEKGPSES